MYMHCMHALKSLMAETQPRSALKAAVFKTLQFRCALAEVDAPVRFSRQQLPQWLHFVFNHLASSSSRRINVPLPQDLTKTPPLNPITFKKAPAPTVGPLLPPEAGSGPRSRASRTVPDQFDFRILCWGSGFHKARMDGPCFEASRGTGKPVQSGS